MERENKLDCYFALFNCHINDALNRTCDKFKEIYGAKRFESNIKPFIDKGIMSMFNQSPNKYLKFFIFYNKRIVNGE